MKVLIIDENEIKPQASARDAREVAEVTFERRTTARVTVWISIGPH